MSMGRERNIPLAQRHIFTYRPRSKLSCAAWRVSAAGKTSAAHP
jgi:hypothetical protein